MSYNNVEDYVKNAESNRNPAVLNSLLKSEPGMKELPEITAEDEGKILQVNNGKPSWSNGGSSGGGVLVVKFTADRDGWTCDKTYAEIVSAITSGTPVMCVTGVWGTGNVKYYDYTSAVDALFFEVAESTLYVTTLTIDSSNSVDESTYSITLK